MTKKYLIFIIIAIGWLQSSPPLKTNEIENFIIARYLGDTSSVGTMLSEDFKYFHVPYIGLGFKSRYIDGHLLVTSIVNDSLQTTINIGDRIHEYNGKPVDSLGINGNGPEGKEQKLIITKKGDSTFSEVNIPLLEYQFIEDRESFLSSIMDYNNAWYDFDIYIKDLIIKKNKVFVQYRWEGSKEPLGENYSFYAIEILTLNKKRDIVTQIDGLWSEKQFRDQFK